MRFPVSTLALSALLLTGCAFEGTIVRKESRPHPLYHSVGVEGMYAFLLRDGAGVVRRQMVTPEVYERYLEGDYFNDQHSGPTRDGKSDPKVVRTAMRSAEGQHLASRAKAMKPARFAAKSKASKEVANGSSAAQKRQSQRIRRSTPATTDLTVATVVKKKSAATPPPSKSEQINPTVIPPAPAKKRSSPEVTIPTMKSAPANHTPMLPMTGGGSPDDPQTVFIPPRVR